MTIHQLNTLGLKCPHPILKIALMASDIKPGDRLEVLGDCPTFESDVRRWCERLGKVFLAVQNYDGSKKKIQIQF